jgi:hypothetical protein
MKSYRRQKTALLLSVLGLAAVMTVQPVSAALLINSSGAWTNNAVVSLSNGGKQSNANVNGGFGVINGTNAYYYSNGGTAYMTMQATAGSAQQTYTSGYTYRYKVTGYAALSSQNTTQNGVLLANGTAVAGTLITGPNNNGTFGYTGENAISGTRSVATGDALIGQTVGLKFYSTAAQTQWRNTGSTYVSSLLTSHTNFNGNGMIYSTSFATNSSGALVSTDYVLDMALTGSGTLNSGFIALNNNTTARNEFKIGSSEDTFRTDTVYRISFDAYKSVNGDAAQNDLTFTLGTFSTNITMSALSSPYTFDVNAALAGITNQLLSVDVRASSLTSISGNQYRINDLNITAIPEPATIGMLGFAGAVVLLIRRRLMR